MTQPMNRRRMLAGSATLGALGLGAGACSSFVSGVSGAGPEKHSLTFWNLFAGPAAAHMDAMQDVYRKKNPGVDLSAVHLSWGNPYYTKLSLAILGHRPPDIAISHLSRIPSLARADLLEPYEPATLAQNGMTGGDFTTRAWDSAHVDGKLYGIPLDTHPFVLYYHTEVCKKAGLLDQNGRLRAITGADDFIRALDAARKVTGAYGGVTTNTGDTATCWRRFSSLYRQLAGEILADEGRRVTLDDDAAVHVLDYLRRLTLERKLLPANAAAPATVNLFSTGKAGFLLDGVWAMNSYFTTKTPFRITPLPQFFGSTRTSWADSHTFVLPKDPHRDPARRQVALNFVKSILNASYTWGQGGLVPAWRAVQDSPEYQKLDPQAGALPAAYSAHYDPPAWYSGAGSDLEDIAGSAVSAAENGQLSSARAVAQMRSGLTRYARTPSPIPSD